MFLQTFLLGALQAIVPFSWDLKLFDVCFLPTRGKRLVPGIEPLTVNPLD